MLIKTSEFHKSATRPKEYPTDGLKEVAFAGKSNVGKSSLLNTILNRKNLAKTSSTPGRTQLINYFLINSGLYFVDLPGYGYAKVSKEKKKGWGPMMENYFRNSPNLKCVVLLLDIRRLITEDDFVLIKFLYALNIPIVYVLTKVDKVGSNEMRKQKAKLEKALGSYASDNKFILFSSLKKRGKEEVLSRIDEYLTEEGHKD